MAKPSKNEARLALINSAINLKQRDRLSNEQQQELTETLKALLINNDELAQITLIRERNQLNEKVTEEKNKREPTRQKPPLTVHYLYSLIIRILQYLFPSRFKGQQRSALPTSSSPPPISSDVIEHTKSPQDNPYQALSMNDLRAFFNVEIKAVSTAINNLATQMTRLNSINETLLNPETQQEKQKLEAEQKELLDTYNSKCNILQEVITEYHNRNDPTEMETTIDQLQKSTNLIREYLAGLDKIVGPINEALLQKDTQDNPKLKAELEQQKATLEKSKDTLRKPLNDIINLLDKARKAYGKTVTVDEKTGRPEKSPPKPH